MSLFGSLPFRSSPPASTRRVSPNSRWPVRMAKAISDSELIKRYVAGDRAAFGALAARHEQQVYNVALRMLGKPEDARDAAQDAFIAAMRALPSFRGDAAFTTWLHRITINSCHDII